MVWKFCCVAAVLMLGGGGLVDVLRSRRRAWTYDDGAFHCCLAGSCFVVLYAVFMI